VALVVVAGVKAVDVVHDGRDGFLVVVGGLDDEVGMGVHDAVAEELEAVLVLAEDGAG
jgi:hypothetical protein